MSFRAVVSSSARPLSNSEKKVLTVLLSGSESSTFTASEVANRASTHESTVVRLAQKLGYRGYPELRADLERDAGTSTPTSFMRSTTGYELASFAVDESQALAKVGEHVSQAELNATAEALHAARTIYLFSNPSDSPAVDLLSRRLLRLGKVVVTLGVSAKDIAEHLVSFDSSSALVAFALREASSLLPAVVSEAQRRGGATILITDVPGYHFRPAPSHLLASQRASDSEYNTLLVPIALCYALQLAIFHLDPKRYLAVRDTIDDLTRMAGGADEIPLRT